MCLETNSVQAKHLYVYTEYLFTLSETANRQIPVESNQENEDEATK